MPHLPVSTMVNSSPSPACHEGEAWERWEADRRELSKKFGNARPAPRYGVKSVAVA